MYSKVIGAKRKHFALLKNNNNPRFNMVNDLNHRCNNNQVPINRR
jgi:hypothetical protein